MVKDYGYQVQKLYLEMMLSDAEVFVRCQGIFDHTLFDRRLATAAEFINEYAKQYSILPDREMVNASCRTDLEAPPTGHTDWLMDEFESFTRHKAIERAIIASADLLADSDYGQVESLIREAVQIGLARDMGTEYFLDPLGRLEGLRDRNGQVSTGWPSLDQKLFGGVSRGELSIFAGASGAGKSLFLANLGVNWALSGLNVVYLSLELSESLVGMRIDSMVTGISTRDIFRNLPQVEAKVKMIGKRSGQLQIKYMPSGKTVNDIRAYIKEYEIQYSRRCDVLLVDYLDLLMPVGKKISAENLFVKDKYVSEELRNFAMEKQVILVTAAQLNRCLALDTVVIANGVSISIQDVQEGDWLDSNEGPVQVYERCPITTQPVYKIKTALNEIVASGDHKFPTQHGLKTIATGLAVGDLVFIQHWGPHAIIEIEFQGEVPTIDINTTGNRLFYANGILTHNSATEEVEFDHSHISGGLSKIQTADNVFGIFTSRAMRERGRYQIQLMKTRSSSGVGQKVDLEFNIDSLRISDCPQDDAATSTSSVIDNIKRKTTQNEPKIKGVVNSSKLRDILNGMNDADHED